MKEGPCNIVRLPLVSVKKMFTCATSHIVLKGFREEVVVVSEAVAGAVTVGGALIACAWDAVCFLALALSYSSSFVRFEFNY